MAKRRGRPRKSGPRTKNGRLSKAHRSPELRDNGTLEAQHKRRLLVGDGADTTLAATCPGILHARGHLDKDQYAEAIEYRRLRCIIYGAPWPGYAAGSQATEERLIDIQARFERKVRRLTEEQKQIITNVCVFDRYPNWFYADFLNLKPLPEDYAERDALIRGLDALVGAPAERKAA